MNPTNLPELMEIWQETLHWQPTQAQLEQWEKLYQEIISANRQINLTRITEPQDFWEKHLWDSLAGIIDSQMLDLEASLKVIDIGTGAGFPGLPVAITFPHWQVTLLDSTQKKIKFINLLLEKFELKNCDTLVGRSEAIAQMKTYRETYDLALIRAVGEPSVCAEYTLPFLKLGGIAVLYRGHWQPDDELTLQSALKQLGGKITLVKQFETPLTHSMRHFVYVRKIAKTPREFPRQIGIPTQYPL